MLKKKALDSSHFLLSVRLEKNKIPETSKYPFSIPAVRGLGELVFNPAVTFLVGENGAGKSTLIEAIAVAYGFNPEGGSVNFNFSTRTTHSELHAFLKLHKGIKRPEDGYFLRAESFYNLATNIEELDKGGGSRLIDSYGGRSLHGMSHGESFMALMLNRFRGRGLYILDEPEAALSPLRLLSMLARMGDLVKLGSQFIISTHSPILMAYPEATIYQIDDAGIAEIPYEETRHYILTRQFLNNRSSMLKELL